MATQKVAAPAGAATTTISVLPEHSLQLDFDTNNTTVNRTDNDLTFSFNDGGTVVITDFFVTEGEELPMFVLPDGVEISSAELLQNINPDLDLTTAAGPTARADGSGAGEYGDGAGDLLGGLDRLGSLGTFQWGREVEDSGTDIMSLGALDTGIQSIIPGPGDLPEEGPNPIPVEDLGYMARAVVYASDKQENNAAVFRLLDENGDPISDLSSVNYRVEGVENGYFQLPPTVNADGSLSLELTDAGFQALQGASENIHDFVTVVVGNKSYLMQVVVSPDGDFNSAGEDALLAAQNIDGSTMYEWHIELGGSKTSGDRIAAQDANTEFIFSQDPNATDSTRAQNFSGSYTSGNGDDYVSFNAARGLEGAEIITGAGADTVELSTNQGMKGATIDTGKDVGDSVTIRVDQSFLGNAMDGSKGNNSIVSTDVNLIHTTHLYSVKWGAVHVGSVIFNKGSSDSGSKSNQIDAAHNTLVEYKTEEDDRDLVQQVGGHGGTASTTMYAYLLETSGYYATNSITSGNDTVLRLEQYLEHDIPRGEGVTVAYLTQAGISAQGGGAQNIINSDRDTLFTADVHSALAYNGELSGQSIKTDFLRAWGGKNTIESKQNTLIDVSNEFEMMESEYTDSRDFSVSFSNTVISSLSSASNSITSDVDTEIKGRFVNTFESNLAADYGAKSEFLSYGIVASGQGSKNEITSGGNTSVRLEHINMDKNSIDSNVVGMQAKNESYENSDSKVENSIISGGETIIAVKAQGIEGTTEDYAYGLQAFVSRGKEDSTDDLRSAKNTITSDDIEVTVTSNTANAYGLDAGYRGENILQSHDNTALSLIITAKGAKDSYSLSAREGVNQIIGQSQNVEGSSDKITLVGDLFTGAGGLNSILTGAGNDEVTIKGDITTEKDAVTKITTGAGDDVIIIEGKIVGDLTIDMGEGGYDVLTLTAPSAADFSDWYGDWLGSLDAADLEAMNVEFIKFECVGGLAVLIAEYPEAQDFVNLAVNSGIRVEVGGESFEPAAGVAPFAIVPHSIHLAGSLDEQADEQASDEEGEVGLASSLASTFAAPVMARSDFSEVSLRSLAGFDTDLSLSGEGANRLVFNAENSFSLNGTNAENIVSSFELEGLILDFSNTAAEETVLSQFLDSSAADEGIDTVVSAVATVESGATVMNTGFTYDAWSGTESEEALLLVQQEILSITGN